MMKPAKVDQLTSSFILHPSSLVVLCGLILSLPPASAQRAIGWRTDGTGKYPNVSPPTEWSRTKNVVWSTKLPNWGNSSPAISQGRIFVCAEPNTLVCLSASDGKILWQKANSSEQVLSPEQLRKWEENRRKADELAKQVLPVGEALINAKRELRKNPDDAEAKKKVEQLTRQRNDLNAQIDAVGHEQPPGTHPENGYSSCTPTTDGKHVYALFGNGVAVCYDFEGNRQWIKLVEIPSNGQGQSSSPLLVGDKLVLLINSLTALKPDTGEQLWRATAPQRWGSPVLAKAGNVEVVVTPGGDVVRLADGKVLANGVSTLDYCAPIVEGDVAYFVQHGGKAVRLTPPNSDTIKPEVLWETKPASERYYASPVILDGLIYAVMQQGEFSVIEAGSGKVIHSRKLNLGATIYSSVTFAKGLLYVSAENGKTVVLEPGREPKEIARNELEAFRSCPVFIGNHMYVKTREKMYCIGGN